MKKISNYLNIQQQVTCQLNNVHSMAGCVGTAHLGLPVEQPPPEPGTSNRAQSLLSDIIPISDF